MYLLTDLLVLVAGTHHLVQGSYGLYTMYSLTCLSSWQEPIILPRGHEYCTQCVLTDLLVLVAGTHHLIQGS